MNPESERGTANQVVALADKSLHRVNIKRVASIFPDQLPPVSRNHTISQSSGNHALMRVVGSQHMAATAQGSQIAIVIAAPFAHLQDVVDVSLMERQ
jgi:pyruvoyl-dependent arginine decarboxylase (PvlArgDC)